MKSRMIAGIMGGIFTLIIFVTGFISGFYLNESTLASSYTKEHVDNGRLMLLALKYLEKGETDKAKQFLSSQVTTKVTIVESARLPPTSQREIQLIENFYSEVINYFDSQGGFNETWKVMENDTWVTKPTPTMEILESFKTNRLEQ